MTRQAQLWVFCGPNGAGKSTLYRRLFDKKIRYINPDDIEKKLQLCYPDISKTNSQVIAAREALILRAEYLDNRYTFAIETTLSGHSELNLIKKAKDKGYKINLIYVGLSSKYQSLARVKTRVFIGGHNIPLEAINRRYAKSLDNLLQASLLADRLFIFDNSGKKHRLLLTFKNKYISYKSKRQPNWYQTISKALEGTLEIE